MASIHSAPQRLPADCVPSQVVVSIKEYPELIGRSDRVHFASMPGQRQAIVTQDLDDFRALLAEAIRAAAKTYCLVGVLARVLLSRKAVGQVVEMLEPLLRQHPGHEDLIAWRSELWLQDEGPPIGVCGWKRSSQQSRSSCPGWC